MPGTAAKIMVTETQQGIPIALRDARTSPKHWAQRAAVVLLGFERVRNEEIAEGVGVGRPQAGLWRRRWRDDRERLTHSECTEPRAVLQRAIVERPPPG